MRLLQRNDPHEELFSFYTEALTLLADDRREEQVLRRFEIQMFNALGYAWSLIRMSRMTGRCYRTSVMIISSKPGRCLLLRGPRAWSRVVHY